MIGTSRLPRKAPVAAQAAARYRSTTSTAIPHTSVRRVTGTPTLAYSRNPIRTPPDSARSATIRFAIEPMSSRFPAKVELTATTRHSSSASGRRGTVFRHRITAGTLEIRFDRVTITAPTVVARPFATGGRSGGTAGGGGGGDAASGRLRKGSRSSAAYARRSQA